MRAVIADTGPMYAAVDVDDQYHERAQAELQLIEANQPLRYGAIFYEGAAR